MAMAFAAAPVGIFATGWLTEALGLRPTLAIFGGLYVFLICYALASRPLRALAAPPEGEHPPNGEEPSEKNPATTPTT